MTKLDSLEQKQQVLLVLLDLGGRSDQELDWELAELKELVLTAGGQVVGAVKQHRIKPDSALLVGRGKVEEIAGLVAELGATLVIFNRQLSPAQLRNLEEEIPVQVLDRNQLILDIFVQRAASLEGKLQVELAQLQYMLPRLTGRGTELSRLGGGIGTRGPGETKLETDRRRIRQKISLLQKELEEVAKRREHQRKNRKKQGIPLVSLVGYTNAGKTSLMNALTAGGQQGEDKLFATLDTTIRQLELPSSKMILLSDTVGFIQQLPPQLVKAFQATLEEIKEADLIIHVVDAGHPRLEEQAATVNQVLQDIQADRVARVIALNKIDLLEPVKFSGQAVGQAVGQADEFAEIELLLKAGGAGEEIVPVSAIREDNLDELLKSIERNLNKGLVPLEVVIPYQQGQFIAYLKEKAVVNKVEYVNDGIKVEMLADEEVKGVLRARGLSGII